MCGIAGLVRWSKRRPDEASVGARMAATLRHRGPDDAGLYEDECASLGHSRLSIIDIEGGHQPLANEDGSIRVVFNGEIYNHLELRSGLQARGHHLRSRCDTEVIVHLYEELGADFVHRLNGMFAIALWDARQRQLLLARDRLGEKPLYWHDDGCRLVFGSELKALLAAGDFSPRIDPCALSDYLTFGHIAAPRSVFEGVRKLEPGHWAICAESGVRIRRYWDIPPAELCEDSSGGAQRAAEEFAALFEDAVRIRMMADVPLGALLSGGLDSACVTAGMRRAGAPRILTHTAGFGESRFDERDAARETAALLGADHHEVTVSADIADLASKLAWHFDEPFADASAVPTYLLCRAARERVTVALAGDGADELLGGYRRYPFGLAEERWRARMPSVFRSACARLGEFYPKADWMPRPLRAKVTLQNLARDAATAHLYSTSLQQGTMPLLLRPELRPGLILYSPFDHRRRLAGSYPSDHLLGRLLYLDSKTLLPDRMLTKVDRASMAVGLEVREPFLDYRLVELIARLPPGLRLCKQVARSTLRQWGFAALARRQKKGFEVPLDLWFRGPLKTLAHDLLTSRDAHIAEWLDARAVRRICARHNGGWSNMGAVLWSLLSLELWARQVRAADPNRTGRTGGRPVPQVGVRQRRASQTERTRDLLQESAA